MYDPDARAGAGWWHWLLFNIPATVNSLAAGAGSDGSRQLPAGAVQGRNDFGVSQYSGPCPPIGDHAHHYEITVYAIKIARLPLDDTASGTAASSTLASNALATAKIVGRYGRSN
jgi:Raf kinase inhibitor-like YbhB/YbcL family protein